MSNDKLIAEISEDKIIYASYQKKDDSNYQILAKKVSKNIGIKKGKITDFNLTKKKISQDLKDLEKKSEKIYKNISLVINEPEMLCINISGFKKLNGSKVEKRDIDYILNEVKSSIQKNQEKNSIIHIINSSFILDNKKQNRIPLGKNGDHLGLHMTFITLAKNKIKSIKSIFNDTGLKIERVINKPLACGIDLMIKEKKIKNFILICFDKETSSVSIYEDLSLVFVKTFPFGTNYIYRDINQLCLIEEEEIKNILRKLNFDDFHNKGNNYIDKNLFTKTQFKKVSINQLKNIILARVHEMSDYLFNQNKNLNYLNRNIIKTHIFFEDEYILSNLGNIFQKSLKIDVSKTQIELMSLNDFSALNGAAELIYKGWDREAIPLKNKKKSVISSFFELFF